MEERRKYHPVDSGERQWHRLLAFALERADAFECALPYPYVAQDFTHLPLWPKDLAPFRPDIIDRHVSLIRWDIAQERPVQFVRFRLTPGLYGFVQAVRSLGQWQWRLGAPEDPAFYQGDTLLLATDSRDGRIAVFADAVDRAHLSGAGIRLLEPLGVTAEPWPTP